MKRRDFLKRALGGAALAMTPGGILTVTQEPRVKRFWAVGVDFTSSAFTGLDYNGGVDALALGDWDRRLELGADGQILRADHEGGLVWRDPEPHLVNLRDFRESDAFSTLLIKDESAWQEDENGVKWRIAFEELVGDRALASG